MEFFTSALEVMKLGVCGFGAGYAVVGIVNFLQGNSQHNASKKEEGFGQIMGGGGIFAVGMILVPQLSKFFNF